MNQPKGLRAAEANGEEYESDEDEEDETFSLLDPEVEAPINAAVHFDDQLAKKQDPSGE
jgi:hypothetical protein